MKRIITLLVLLVSVVTNAQQFRINEKQKKEVVKLDSSSLTYIMLIEGVLNSNNKLLDKKDTSISDPSIGMLNNTISKLKDKDKKKFESLVCESCYEDEWKQQQDTKKRILDAKELEINDIPNIEYIRYIRNLTKEDTEKVVREILSTVRGDYDVVTTSGKDSNLLEYWILTKEQIAQVRSGEKEIFLDFEKDLWKIKFERRFEGENKALEIKGKETYSFSTVTFNYLDLFPYWKKRFVLNATPEEVLKDYNAQEFRVKNKSIHWLYKFKPNPTNEKIWTLNMFY
ncbi:hypothetical protein MODO_3147 [Myroides odoratimimus]|uniref:hypothetical protein n=1 Tax=Myroides odoratimimus TaxID=76832 RepID=UPI00072BA850|nr:hypothetical protein [Myroides odoratimimus]GAQ15451.1 hypothetical protein MODO_3147 [Myroides odoratimimus]STZ48150.1 Uncharacterised protein [Myroides odoratimimus]